jgi:Response regulator containing a CheY-like receiver domain and an HD-GYP domain
MHLKTDGFLPENEAVKFAYCGEKMPLTDLKVFQKRAIRWLAQKKPQIRPEDLTVVVEDSNEWSARMFRLHEEIAIAFAEISESRDKLTPGHARRSAELVEKTVEELNSEGFYSTSLTPYLVRNLVIAAPLHDVGKIVIPDVILNKPGRLNPREFEIMKSHTTEGKAILERISKEAGGAPLLSLAAEIAWTHHERWDGTGYPRGLRGNDIPLSGRIMAVADVYDALVSERPYKAAWSIEKALAEIISESGTHFDPIVAAAFLKVVSSFPEPGETTMKGSGDQGRIIH